MGKKPEKTRDPSLYLSGGLFATLSTLILRGASPSRLLDLGDLITIIITIMINKTGFDTKYNTFNRLPKGDELPIKVAYNRRQWTRKSPGHNKCCIVLRRY